MSKGIRRLDKLDTACRRSKDSGQFTALPRLFLFERSLASPNELELIRSEMETGLIMMEGTSWLVRIWSQSSFQTCYARVL